MSARHANLDGALFGTNYSNTLFKVNAEVRPKRSKAKFVPMLYGFNFDPFAYRSGSKKDSQEADT